jgi:RNA polymerase sigma-70 factor (ECF subfamily)
MSDVELLRGLRAGKDEAFATLVRSHGGRMLAVARRFLSNEEDARDAVQDAFLSAFRAIDRFEGDAKLSTWLHRIVVNASLMKLRTRRRRPEGKIDDLLPHFLENGHQAEPAAQWPRSADALIESAENRSLVRAAIDELPENYRTVLLLRDIEEYDTQQAAEALGLSRAAVKTRLHRARQALRQLLDEHFRLEDGQGAASNDREEPS